MPWREFVLWQAYFEIEPPDMPANERSAAVMATIANMAGKSLPQGKTVTVDDLLGRARPAQSIEQQIAFMKSLGN